MLKLNTARLRAFLLAFYMLPLLTGCNVIRNALTPLKTEVTLIDTVLVEAVRVDTIIVTLPVDTLVIETERVSARVIRSYDTITLDVECKADTVIVTNTVELPTKTRTVTRVPWWFKPALVIGGLIFALAVSRALFRP
jgi:hypothetical protein